MGTIAIFLILTVISCVVSILCLIMAIFMVIEVRSFQKSTHQIQYEPVDFEKFKQWASNEKDLESEFIDLPEDERTMSFDKEFEKKFK